MYVPKAYDTVRRNELWKHVGLGSEERSKWRMMKNLTECARRAMMLDGEISKNVDILRGVLTLRCTIQADLFVAYIR